MNNERRKKLQRVIRSIVSKFIIEEFPDNDNIFGIINIGDVILSTDGSYLDVHVSSFQEKNALTKALAKHAYIIQRHIGKDVGLRMNPKLRFRYDESGEIGDVVTNEINNLNINSIEEKLVSAEQE